MTQRRVDHPPRAGRCGQDFGQQDGLVQDRGVTGGHGWTAMKEKRTPSGDGVRYSEDDGADGARTRDLRSDSAAL